MALRATIDVGTNTVLLLVAEERGGTFAPVEERAEITRLGRGVDGTGWLDTAAIAETVAVVARFAAEARTLGATSLDCVATSASRDAENGEDFFRAVRDTAGIEAEVISGEEEARLVWKSTFADFGAAAEELLVLDVGGGSTELCVGDGPAPRARRSLQLGAVRLTERVAPADPPGAAALVELRARAAEALSPAREPLSPRAGARLVAVAGTVTTLAAVEARLAVYDGARVHGSELTLEALMRLYARLGALTTAERAALPGMEPKRADVILGGAAIVIETLRLFGLDRLTVSDRGVRWGLLYDRYS